MGSSAETNFHRHDPAALSACNNILLHLGWGLQAWPLTHVCPLLSRAVYPCPPQTHALIALRACILHRIRMLGGSAFVWPAPDGVGVLNCGLKVFKPGFLTMKTKFMGMLPHSVHLVQHCFDVSRDFAGEEALCEFGGARLKIASRRN